jgi:hypothetical protein
MKRMLTTGVVALAFALTLGANAASADHVDVQLEIKNGGQSGHVVTATTGEKVKFTVKVKNLSKQSAPVTVVLTATVPSIPGCTVTETRTIQFHSRETKQEWMSGVVPVGRSGVLLVDVSATIGTHTDTDHAQLTFGPAKTTESAGEGWFHQAYVRVLVKGLMMALANSTDGVVDGTISDVKSLFR